MHSLSWAAPHLFGDRLADFDEELRDLLDSSCVGGSFTERMRPVVLDVWR